MFPTNPQIIRQFGKIWAQSLSFETSAPTMCYWHAGCGNEATTDVLHIGVGEVPACESCAYYARPLIDRIRSALRRAFR